MVFFLDIDGPELLCSTPNSIFSVNDYYHISSYFYVSLGHGNTRNYGIFELPVYNFPDLHAFVYAFDIKDRNNKDVRNIEQTFCLLVIVFEKDLRGFLPHPTIIETFIQYRLKSYNELYELCDLDLYKSIFQYLEEYLESSNAYFNLERFKLETKVSSCTTM